MQHAFLTAVFAGVLVLSGCKPKAAVVEITETRELTTEDTVPKLKATSAERFQGSRAARPQGYRFVAPAGWKEQPAGMMRTLSFAFGPEGEGEVYLSQTGGDVASNVNRWRRQFGMPALTPAEIGQLPTMVVLGKEMVRVEAEGTYSPGMGRPARGGSALLGVIGQVGGQIITVKMVGPSDLVQAENGRFGEFVGSLQRRE